MKIVIVRHGDPNYETDSLTPAGKIEAELLVPRIKSLCADEYYVSPLGRARETAAPSMAALGKQAAVLDWLQEFPAYTKENGEDSLPWDLMPSYWTSDERYYSENEWYNTDLMKTGPIKKTFDSVTAELDGFLAKHGYRRDGRIYRAENPNSKTIVLFCHFGIECVFLSHILGVAPHVLWQGFVALPTSVTTLVTEEREKGIAAFRCNGFGDVSHLYAAGREPSFAARFCELYTNSDERH